MSDKPRRGIALDDVPESQGRAKITDFFDGLKWPTKPKYIGLRPVGNLAAYGMHWLKIKSKKGQLVNIGKQCLAFDSSTGTRDSTKPCPYCDLGADFAVQYYMNVIVRELQDNEPRKKPKPTKQELKTGYKEMGSDTWTPVRVIRLPEGGARALRGFREMNKHKDADGTKKMYSVTHSKYGRDIEIKYSPEEAGAAMYSYQKGDHTPLTDDEKKYLLFDIWDVLAPETLKEAKAEVKNLSTKLVNEESDDDDEKPKKGKKGKSRDEEEDLEDDDSDSDDDDSDEDEDEDEDDDLGLDDDEDESSSKKKSKSAKSAKSKKTKKSKRDDDEDEDDGDDDEDDERPVKKSKKVKSKKSKRDDDEDDDLDDADDDEDE